jgi:pimeloyl-ACP methyl ester carboxylesterase
VNRPKKIFGIAGLLFAGAGFILLRMQPYRPTTVISTAGTCNMHVDVLGSKSSEADGYVVLLHGLSANKRVMSYLARAFSDQNLRVFVPDLPGHGSSPGPFSYARAESCVDSLVEDLKDRRAILLDRTLLVGHSLGGAIALRVATHFPVAGVIAISPAPMHASPELPPEMIPYHKFGALPSHALIINGAWEPQRMRQAAANLLATGDHITDKYVLLPHATHVSLLFDSRVAALDRSWAANLLGANPTSPLPSHWALYGFFFGFIGLAILALPFLREVVGNPDEQPRPEILPKPPAVLALLQVAIVSALVVLGLTAGVPLRGLRIFQGDYLVSFFALGGLALTVWNRRLVTQAQGWRLRPILGGAFAAIALIVLFGAWFNLSLYEAWLTVARWLRLPLVALLFFPWLFAEEILLGPAESLSRFRRLALALAFRLLAWGALIAALFLLHSGEILLFLLGVYFGIFFILERMACGLVRRETHSPAAAALFGAILFAGLALAIFPIA